MENIINVTEKFISQITDFMENNKKIKSEQTITKNKPKKKHLKRKTKNDKIVFERWCYIINKKRNARTKNFREKILKKLKPRFDLFINIKIKELEKMYKQKINLSHYTYKNDGKSLHFSYNWKKLGNLFHQQRQNGNVIFMSGLTSFCIDYEEFNNKYKKYVETKFIKYMAAYRIQNRFRNALVNPNCRYGINHINKQFDEFQEELNKLEND